MVLSIKYMKETSQQFDIKNDELYRKKVSIL